MYVNGELKKITDKNGTLRYEINSSGSQNWYDEKCRLIKHDDVEYEYDNRGNCIKKINEKQITEFLYDKNNHLVKKQISSDGKILNLTEYLYDSNGYCYYEKETDYKYDGKIKIKESFYINEYSYFNKNKIKECYRYRTQSYHYYLDGNTFHEEGWW